MRATVLPHLRLMLVTDAALTAQRGLVETVLAAVAGGVTSVQLRDKHADERSMIAAATRLKTALAPTGVPLFINDRVSVAQAIAADGLHIGQEDGDPAMARAMIGPDAFLGLSVTRAEDVATVDPAIVDYAGLGPVFATTTKGDAAPALGPEETARIGGGLTVPFIAIGGIDASNAGMLMRAGAAGVAVVSAICAAERPQEAARTLRSAIDGATA